MILGNYEFKDGDEIYIGAYIFKVRRGEIMLQKITVIGGLGYVDFEAGIFLLLLQNVPSWSIVHKG